MTAALALRDVSKSFGGVRALDQVDFVVEPGEVHGLLGQNGSGKSTLVKILAGYHHPDSGAQMAMYGERLPLPVISPQRHGIAVIHQDLGLVETMSIVDNLGVSSSYGARSLAPIRTRRERQHCAEILEAFGVHLPLDRLIGQLSAAERAAVAIARATRVLRQHTRTHLFVLDEPTTYLAGPEAGRVMDLMRAVKRSGASVIFISHRLQEMLDVTDRVTVLRDGRVVGTMRTTETTKDKLMTAMLGRKLESFYPDRTGTPPGDSVLEVKCVSGRHVLDVSFRVRSGEVVGITGLTGMGQSDVPYLVAGVVKADSGVVHVAGESVLGFGPREMLARKVALVPGNRHRDGGWVAATAKENITLPLLGSYYRRGFLRLRLEHKESRALMERLGVRPPEPERPLNTFSGGNQQKVILAKWLSTQPRLLLLDEPTQGVDAGAKHDILKLVIEIARAGAGVLMASGDYEQLANVCDRVLVMRDGRVHAELQVGEMTEERLAACAQGDR